MNERTGRSFFDGLADLSFASLVHDCYDYIAFWSICYFVSLCLFLVFFFYFF